MSTDSSASLDQLPLPEQLEFLAKAFGLRVDYMAGALGVSLRTLRGYKGGSKQPGLRVSDRVAKLRDLYDLMQAHPRPDMVLLWLGQPHDALNRRRPRFVLAEGKIDEVISALRAWSQSS